MNSEEVKSNLKADDVQNAICITQHSGFDPMCLQKWSLKLAAGVKNVNKSKHMPLITQGR